MCLWKSNVKSTRRVHQRRKAQILVRGSAATQRVWLVGLWHQQLQAGSKKCIVLVPTWKQ